MTVHVDELHTELVPGPPADGGGGRPPPPWVAAQRWRDARGEAERLARRTAAEGFDD